MVYCSDFDDGYCDSDWDRWGRWVAFGVIVGTAFLLFLAFAFLNARRRRSRGLQPITGTAWMAPPPGPPPPNQPYYHNEQFYQPPPPQYSASPTNYGYFGAQPPPGSQPPIELQTPPGVHPAPEHNYGPPQGPPPAKY
ncbi:hypothetical protein N7468_010637 [Penicillium chermesinum]|uniref:Chitin synthesis regulation, Congo red resistance, RCR protein n=1 Tax=Penicillium chermesinum TaxID=63820 RepID=A0A9W9N9J4_9EURO|nr:uncharacterized protein N7468_010637 [Penicillium chermesinum]KAJ5214958.1 hypothetical protein N7468_010637 [Penicillium chermesinum]KAJ6141538.1 hypothetical protein N7470_009928 [Penicillium chermesinum]